MRLLRGLLPLKLLTANEPPQNPPSNIYIRIYKLYTADIYFLRRFQ